MRFATKKSLYSITTTFEECCVVMNILSTEWMKEMKPNGKTDDLLFAYLQSDWVGFVNFMQHF